MKLSEAINALQSQLEKHGDIDMASVTDVDGQFIFNLDRIFEVVEMPDDYGTDFIKVSAFIEPLEENQDPVLEVIK